MKTIFYTTAAVLALSGAAFAQTVTGPTTLPGDSATAHQNNNATSERVNTGLAAALDSNGGGADETAHGHIIGKVRATANFNSLAARGATAGGLNAALGSQSSNAGVQFQIGNNNQSVNIQTGSGQESATVQNGGHNIGIISQQTQSNEAAIAQLGDHNNTAIFQDGVDNAAASAVSGEHNDTVILQQGGDNMSAQAIDGMRNKAVVFQNSGDNTAAQLQLGDDNTSFISQGGGTSQTMAAIDGTLRDVDLPSGVFVNGSTPGTALRNSAASMQVGTFNVSAILQQGNENQAVNYQSN